MFVRFRLLLFSFLGLAVGKAAGEKPNLVVFLVDDMGIMDTSVPFFQGAGGRVETTGLNRTFRTPAMERLAARGMKFTKAYAMPVCSPSRVCLMTGMNSARHHVTNWTSPDEGAETGQQRPAGSLGSPREWRRTGYLKGWPSLAGLLRGAGYRTIHVGKAHFGNDGHSVDPRNLGFDVNVGGRSIGQPGSYSGNYGKGGRFAVPHLERHHGSGVHLSDALTLEMNAAIEEAVEAGRPFFAHMSHYAVHAPFEVDPRFSGNYPGLTGQALAYATLIEGMDKSLGDMMDHLEEIGVAENTLVVFLSDNGSDSPLFSAPLRANKGSKYEGGVRVPMIAAWAKPDAGNAFQRKLPIRPGSRSDEMAVIFDWFPTLLDVAGVKAPAGHAVDGIDLSPALRGGRLDRTSLLIHFPHAHRSDFYTMFRSGDEKLIYNYGPKSYELYDLARDPGEKNDLSAKRPARVKALARGMAEELRAHGAQWPVRPGGEDEVLVEP